MLADPNGDCLGILRELNSERIDLINLDPQLNSDRDYSARIVRAVAVAAFEDT